MSGNLLSGNNAHKPVKASMVGSEPSTLAMSEGHLEDAVLSVPVVSAVLIQTLRLHH